MRAFFKRIASKILIPTAHWYLRKDRTYTYQQTTVIVYAGVFHPGFFYSTKFLLDHLNSVDLNGKAILELGCGTGLISVVCAKKGAQVTATDLSKKAIENVKTNAALNKVDIRVIHSDLFDNIPSHEFNYIIINPPYYAKPVSAEPELAWHCGENFEYFKKLFNQLREITITNGKILMVLTKGCDIGRISAIASQHGFQLRLEEERPVVFDGTDFIFSIHRN